MVAQGNLQETLEAFDVRVERFTEHEVSKAIRRLRDKDDPSTPPLDWLAEAMAFDFSENYEDREAGWGTYFGPWMVFTKDDGARDEYPSISSVTEEILEYWG